RHLCADARRYRGGAVYQTPGAVLPAIGLAWAARAVAGHGYDAGGWVHGHEHARGGGHRALAATSDRAPASPVPFPHALPWGQPAALEAAARRRVGVSARHDNDVAIVVVGHDVSGCRWRYAIAVVDRSDRRPGAAIPAPLIGERVVAGAARIRQRI